MYSYSRYEIIKNLLSDDERAIVSAALVEFVDSDRWDEFDVDVAEKLATAFEWK